MKIAAIVAATMITATAASAAEIGATGISIGAEVDTYWEKDADAVQSVLTPELGYKAMGIDFTASTDLNLITDGQVVAQDMFDDKPVLSFGAGYTVNMGVAARVYGEVDVDTDGFDTSGAKVGLSFKF